MLAAAMLAGLLPSLPASGETLPPLTTLQISALSAWTDSLGNYRVVGEVTNGDATLSGRFIKVQCTIHDQTKIGNPAVTLLAFAEAELLKPAEKSPFEVIFQAAPATHDAATCAVSGRVTHAIPDHDFAVTITGVTTGTDGNQQVKGNITNNRNASVGPVKLMLTYYTSPGVPVDETSHYLTTNANSSLGPLQQVDFIFERFPPPNGPAWTYTGSGSIGSLAEAPAPTTELAPTSLAFGPQIDGTPSAAQTLNVANIGTGDLHVASAGIDNTRDFQIAVDRCSGMTVGAGLSCGIDIVFDPQVLGPSNATISVADDAPGSPHTATLTGTGLSRTDGRVSPTALGFGEQGVTTSSPPQMVTLTSVGPDPLGQISVAASANFAVAADGCSGTTVAVGSTCTIGVSFAPSTTGPLNGLLSITDNGRSSPQTVTLTGTGSLLAVTISPSIVDFGTQVLGTTSAAASVTFNNVGSASAPLGTVMISGVNGADFAMTSDLCSGVLVAPKSSCSITIRFTPGAAGSRTGVVNFPVTGRSLPLTVLLMGSGQYPTPPPLNGGAYHPLDPVRILDTRVGPTPVGRGLGAVGPGQTIDVQITGRGNVPDGAAAVVVNVTVTGTTGNGYLTVFPTQAVAGPPPLASNLNWTAGSTVPNLVEVAIGVNGRISIFNGPGSAAHVIVDVEGYVSMPTATPGRDGRFVPTVPARVLDTRTGPAPANAGLGPVPGGTSINVKVLGAGGVPASGVGAVVINVTVTGPTSEGFLTVYPAGVPQPPLASNLNFSAGQTVPNRVIVKVGANGAISIYNGYGFAHVVVDVNGWFSDDTNWQLTGSGFKGTALPTRILDTRYGTADLGSPIGAIGPDSTMSLPVAGRGGVPGMTAHIPPTAVVLNVTVTNPTLGDHLTIFPGLLSSRPLASDLNFVAGETVPNLVVVKLGADGSIQIYNGQGFTDVVADVVGWYS